MNAHPQDIFNLQNGARLTPSPGQQSKRRRGGNDFYEMDELLAKIHASLIVNEAFENIFKSMWGALSTTQGAGFWVNKDKAAAETYKYSAPHLFAALCSNAHVMNVEGKGIHFASPNGMISANHGTFQFIPAIEETDANSKTAKTPPRKKMSLEDAYNVLLLASFSAQSPRLLELNGGSRAERAIYYQAIKAFNESVSPEMKFVLDADLAIKVASAPAAGKELDRYMAKVRQDHSAPNADLGDVPANPVITPEAAEAAEEPVLPAMSKRVANAKLRKWNEFLATPAGEAAFKSSEVCDKSGPETRDVHALHDSFKGGGTAYVIKYKKELLVIGMEDGKSAWNHEKFYRLGATQNKKPADSIPQEKTAGETTGVNTPSLKAAFLHPMSTKNLSLGAVTMDGKPLHENELQNIIRATTFDPQLTLAKAFIGSRVYRLHQDEHLPLDLLGIYEVAAGKHGASVKRFDQTQATAIPLNEIAFPNLPKTMSFGGTVKAKFSFDL